MARVDTLQRTGLLVLTLLVGQFLLLSSQLRTPDGPSLLERVLAAVSAPVVAVGETVGGAVRSGWERFERFRSAKRENEILRARLAEAETEINRLREATLAQARLERLLALREAEAPGGIGARVVGAEFTDVRRMLLLDQGEEAGVRVDAPVVAWGGAVGRVVEAYRNRSRVRLLSDPESAVAGLVQRSRVPGIVQGRGSGLLEMRHVPGFADVALGDRVVTSGLDEVFPKGYTIGTVVYLGEPDGISRTILVQPEVEFEGLEEVLILVPSAPASAGEGSQ